MQIRPATARRILQNKNQVRQMIYEAIYFSWHYEGRFPSEEKILDFLFSKNRDDTEAKLLSSRLQSQIYRCLREVYERHH